MGTDDNSRGPSRTFRREPWQTDSVALQACEAAGLTEAQTIAVLAEQMDGLVKHVSELLAAGGPPPIVVTNPVTWTMRLSDGRMVPHVETAFLVPVKQ